MRRIQENDGLQMEQFLGVAVSDLATCLGGDPDVLQEADDRRLLIIPAEVRAEEQLIMELLQESLTKFGIPREGVEPAERRQISVDIRVPGEQSHDRPTRHYRP